MANEIASSIIFRKTGMKMPQDLLERIQRSADGSVGTARIQDGAFTCLKKAETIDVPAFCALLNSEDVMSSDLLLFLSHRVPPDEELQPTVLLEDEGDEIVVAFGDGVIDWSKFQTLFDETLKEAGGNTDKAMNLMDAAAFRSKVSSCWKDRGHIAVMDISGKVVHFRKNDKFREFDWGWCSNTFEPVQAADPPPPTERKLTPAERIALKNAGKKPDPLAAAVSPTTSVPSIAASAETPETKTDGKKTGKMVKLGPPPKDLSNAQKRSWWDRRLGYHPPNYKTAVLQVDEGEIMTADRPQPVLDKEIEQVVAGAHTIMDPKLIEGTKAEFSKAARKGETFSATARENFVEKYPSWSKQTGIPLEEVFGWTPEELAAYVSKYPRGGFVLAFEVIDQYMQALADLDSQTAPQQPTGQPEKRLTPAERIALKNNKAA